MTASLEELRAELLTLSEDDRAELGQFIFKSFGHPIPGFEDGPGMTAAAEKFCPTLLALSEDDRSDLGHDLLDSLQTEADEEELTAELARREADMLSGKSIPIPYEEVMARLDAHIASLRR